MKAQALKVPKAAIDPVLLLVSHGLKVDEFRDQNGEEVEFKSDAEMARALAALDSEIAAATQRPAHTIRFQTSKGL
ncbi:MAG: hypothetical protein JKY94_10155 [Rhodobacteraceae bacterium]|nr:hypothetical protein [Paracoccaceae bacterium]